MAGSPLFAPLQWLRYTHGGQPGFGTLANGQVHVYEGEMFGMPRATGQVLPVEEITWRTPCDPTKMIALWNNFHAAAAKNQWEIPPEPLYFFKTPNSFCAHRQDVRTPRSYGGRILYEGELGIVIGKRGADIALDNAAAHVFGFTCVNDVTALELLKADPSFAQWSRAKSFDTFGAFGPVIVTGIDAATLSVRTLVNGRERQNYAISDMVFSLPELVHRISRGMTLEAGDIISCGTSLGAGPWQVGATVEVVIDGVGTLSNTLVQG